MTFDMTGRLDDAIEKARQHGVTVDQDTHAIGPYGLRIVVIDSEGNRRAQHSFPSPCGDLLTCKRSRSSKPIFRIGSIRRP